MKLFDVRDDETLSVFNVDFDAVRSLYNRAGIFTEAVILEFPEYSDVVFELSSVFELLDEFDVLSFDAVVHPCNKNIFKLIRNSAIQILIFLSFILCPPYKI